MKLTLVLLLVLGLTLCLAKDANKTQKGHHLVNKTHDKNQTHPDHPHQKPHPLHHKQNETNVTAPSEEETVPAEEATTEDDASRLLAGKKFAHFPRNHPQKGKGKNLRGHGHHEKPSNNATEADSNDDNIEADSSDNDAEDSSTEGNSEEAVVVEQGEDAEDISRLLARKTVRKNRRGAPRRGQKKHGRPHKRPMKPEEIAENTENAEAVVGEDAEDIEHELRRLAGQIQAHKKPARQDKKGGKKHQRKPKIKPELNYEDFEDFFGEHAFENGEAFDFDHHHPKH